MNRLSGAIRLTCATGLWLCAVSVASGELRAAEPDSYAEKLEWLASRCDELGLAEQAALTRGWPVPRAAGRQYLFLPPARDPAQPAESAPLRVRQWYGKFREFRGEQAEALFEEATAALEGGQAAEAYQRLHELLREDPDHAEARRILGYRRVGDVWQHPSRELGVRRIRGAHPRFGWPGGSYWIVRTPHYRITTNHSPEAAEELAALLEELYLVWNQLFFTCWSSEAQLKGWFALSTAPALRGRELHDVVLFRDRSEYIQQLQKVEPQIAVTLGYYRLGDETSFFYAGEQADPATWVHEATHQLFQERTPVTSGPGARANFWVLEGVALYMESLIRARDHWVLGGCTASRLQYARYRALSEGRYLPLRELVRLGRDELQQHPEIRELYSQAAGLTHFFMDYQGGKYRPALLRYLQEVYRGRDGAETLAEVVGVPLEQLDAEYLDYLNVKDTDLSLVPDIQNLQRLCLARTRVTDQGLQAFEETSSLTWLDLSATRVTDQGFGYFRNNRSLEQLSLEQTGISDKSMELIAGFAALEELDLSHTRITDAGLAHLARLPHLKVLWLTGTAVTDEGLGALEGLQQLEMLEVSETSITPQALAQLRNQLPTLKRP